MSDCVASGVVSAGGIEPAVSPALSPFSGSLQRDDDDALARCDRALVASLLNVGNEDDISNNDVPLSLSSSSSASSEASSSAENRKNVNREMLDRVAGFLKKLADETASVCADDSTAALQRVAMEADALEKRMEDVEGRLRALVRENRGPALGTALCTRRALDTCNVVVEQLDRVSASAPQFADSLDAFLRNGQQSVARWEHIQLAFGYLPTASELLAIPKLLDTAIRCRAYEQAAQLVLYVESTLAHSNAVQHPDSQAADDAACKESDAAKAGRAVVEQVVSETRRLQKVLVRALVEELCGPVQLPAIVRAVGLFSRLRVFMPVQMRALFLACREAHLKELCAQLDDLPPFGHITRLNDVFRTTLFDVTTQYRAIFSVTAAPLRSAGINDVKEGDDSYNSTEEQRRALQLHTWLLQRCEWYVGKLRELLSQITDGATVASLMEQCMYTGMSLARVGIDVRPRVAPLFMERIFTMFKTSMDSVVSQFTAAMSVCSFTAATKLIGSMTERMSGNSFTPGQLRAPQRLVNVSLLAAVTNSVVAALNELRHCAIFSLQPRVTDVMNETLQSLITTIAEKAAATAANERGAVHLFCEAFTDDALPYIIKCFDAVWGASAPLIDSVKMMEPLSKFIRIEQRPAEKQEEKKSVDESDLNAKEVSEQDSSKEEVKSDETEKKEYSPAETSSETSSKDEKEEETQSAAEVTDMSHTEPPREQIKESEQEQTKDEEPQEAASQDETTASEPKEDLVQDVPDLSKAEVEDVLEEKPTEEKPAVDDNVVEQDSEKESVGETAGKPTEKKPSDSSAGEPAKEEPLEPSAEEQPNKEPAKEEHSMVDPAKEEPLQDSVQDDKPLDVLEQTKTEEENKS